jgi:hypothetical protein
MLQVGQWQALVQHRQQLSAAVKGKDVKCEADLGDNRKATVSEFKVGAT